MWGQVGTCAGSQEKWGDPFLQAALPLPCAPQQPGTPPSHTLLSSPTWPHCLLGQAQHDSSRPSWHLNVWELNCPTPSGPSASQTHVRTAHGALTHLEKPHQGGDPAHPPPGWQDLTRVRSLGSHPVFVTCVSGRNKLTSETSRTKESDRTRGSHDHSFILFLDF